MGWTLVLLVSVSGLASAQLRDANAFIIQMAKLTASDGVAGDWFGVLVSVSGDTLVVALAGMMIAASSPGRFTCLSGMRAGRATGTR